MIHKHKNSFYMTCTGLDATGKSTLSEKLVNYLNDKGLNCLHVREPGGNPSAEAIRTTMFGHAMDPYTDALMMAAARNELITKTIIPALEEGMFVLSDRSVACSCAYQGWVYGLGINKIWDLNKQFALHDCLPDLEIFLDAPTDVILKRLAYRNNGNRLDNIAHDNVRIGYQKFHDFNYYPVYSIDTSGSQAETFNVAISAIQNFLNIKD